MATTNSVTLGELIDETFEHLYRVTGRPLDATLASAISPTSTTFTLSTADDSIQVTDVLENGQELLLVTAKSDDTTPVFTVVRGYAGTTAVSATIGDQLVVNPPHSRRDIAKRIRRAFQTLMNRHLPTITNALLTRETGLQFIELPANTVKVFSARHVISGTGRIVDVGGWQFEQDLPTTDFTTGKVLRISASVTDTDEIIVVYQTPYLWSTEPPAEDSTIDIPLGTEDIPALWAAAYTATRREIQRSEVDQIEEWNQDQAIRQGVNLRLARDLWGEVYRRVDEARDLQYIPAHRPYRRMTHTFRST